jgi:hypothetical protein
MYVRIASSCLVLLALARTPSRAYVRQYTSDLTQPLAWRNSSCIFITLDAMPPVDQSFMTVQRETQAAAARWTQDCSYMRFQLDAAPSTGRKAGFDGVNLIIFRQDSWGRGAGSGFMPFPPEAAALTHVTFVDHADNPAFGQILDADTELNGVDYAFGVVPTTATSHACVSCPGPKCMMDIQNTLVHELGHMLGLDHTCFDGATPKSPVDGNGNPVPACDGDLPPTVPLTTMYNFADCDETIKQTPEADDVAGAFAIYPVGSAPLQCKRVAAPPPLQAGCAAAPGSSGDAMSLGLVFVLLSRSRRRRRSG